MTHRRIVACVSLVLGSVVAAAAGDASFESTYWDVRYAAEGFVPRAKLGGDTQVFAGSVEGVAVEASVLEGDDEQDAAKWTAGLVATWKGQGRALAASAEPDADGVLLLTDAGIAGAPRRHAFQVHPRGVHAFVVHAVGRPGDDDRLRKALSGFSVGARRGASLRGVAVAREAGVDPSDLRLALAAFERYVSDRTSRPAVAAEIASSLVLAAPAGTFSGDELWSVCHGLALVFLERRENSAAIAWMRKARERVDATTDAKRNLALTLYNTACALAVARDKDGAFAAIDELVAGGSWAENAEWAQKDADLASLRDDARWAKLPRAEGK